MPWNGRSARKHTKAADTPAKKRKWARVANAVLKRTKSEASAVRAANKAVKPKRKR